MVFYGYIYLFNPFLHVGKSHINFKKAQFYTAAKEYKFSVYKLQESVYLSIITLGSCIA